MSRQSGISMESAATSEATFRRNTSDERPSRHLSDPVVKCPTSYNQASLENLPEVPSPRSTAPPSSSRCILSPDSDTPFSDFYGSRTPSQSADDFAESVKGGAFADDSAQQPQNRSLRNSARQNHRSAESPCHDPNPCATAHECAKPNEALRNDLSGDADPFYNNSCSGPSSDTASSSPPENSAPTALQKLNDTPNLSTPSVRSPQPSSIVSSRPFASPLSSPARAALAIEELSGVGEMANSTRGEFDNDRVVVSRSSRSSLGQELLEVLKSLQGLGFDGTMQGLALLGLTDLELEALRLELINVEKRESGDDFSMSGDTTTASALSLPADTKIASALENFSGKSIGTPKEIEENSGSSSLQGGWTSGEESRHADSSKPGRTSLPPRDRAVVKQSKATSSYTPERTTGDSGDLTPSSMPSTLVAGSLWTPGLDFLTRKLGGYRNIGWTVRTRPKGNSEESELKSPNSAATTSATRSRDENSSASGGKQALEYSVIVYSLQSFNTVQSSWRASEDVALKEALWCCYCAEAFAASNSPSSSMAAASSQTSTSKGKPAGGVLGLPRDEEREPSGSMGCPVVNQSLSEVAQSILPHPSISGVYPDIESFAVAQLDADAASRRDKAERQRWISPSNANHNTAAAARKANGSLPSISATASALDSGPRGKPPIVRGAAVSSYCSPSSPSVPGPTPINLFSVRNCTPLLKASTTRASTTDWRGRTCASAESLRPRPRDGRREDLEEGVMPTGDRSNQPGLTYVDYAGGRGPVNLGSADYRSSSNASSPIVPNNQSKSSRGATQHQGPLGPDRRQQPQQKSTDYHLSSNTKTRRQNTSSLSERSNSNTRSYISEAHPSPQQQRPHVMQQQPQQSHRHSNNDKHYTADMISSYPPYSQSLSPSASPAIMTQTKQQRWGPGTSSPYHEAAGPALRQNRSPNNFFSTTVNSNNEVPIQTAAALDYSPNRRSDLGMSSSVTPRADGRGLKPSTDAGALSRALLSPPDLSLLAESAGGSLRSLSGPGGAQSGLRINSPSQNGALRGQVDKLSRQRSISPSLGEAAVVWISDVPKGMSVGEMLRELLMISPSHISSPTSGAAIPARQSNPLQPTYSTALGLKSISQWGTQGVVEVNGFHVALRLIKEIKLRQLERPPSSICGPHSRPTIITASWHEATEQRKRDFALTHRTSDNRPIGIGLADSEQLKYYAEHLRDRVADDISEWSLANSRSPYSHHALQLMLFHPEISPLWSSNSISTSLTASTQNHGGPFNRSRSSVPAAPIEGDTYWCALCGLSFDGRWAAWSHVTNAPHETLKAEKYRSVMQWLNGRRHLEGSGRTKGAMLSVGNHLSRGPNNHSIARINDGFQGRESLNAPHGNALPWSFEERSKRPGFDDTQRWGNSNDENQASRNIRFGQQQRQNVSRFSSPVPEVSSKPMSSTSRFDYGANEPYLKPQSNNGPVSTRGQRHLSDDHNLFQTPYPASNPLPADSYGEWSERGPTLSAGLSTRHTSEVTAGLSRTQSTQPLHWQSSKGQNNHHNDEMPLLRGATHSYSDVRHHMTTESQSRATPPNTSGRAIWRRELHHEGDNPPVTPVDSLDINHFSIGSRSELTAATGRSNHPSPRQRQRPASVDNYDGAVEFETESPHPLPSRATGPQYPVGSGAGMAGVFQDGGLLSGERTAPSYKQSRRRSFGRDGWGAELPGSSPQQGEYAHRSEVQVPFRHEAGSGSAQEVIYDVQTREKWSSRNRSRPDVNDRAWGRGFGELSRHSSEGLPKASDGRLKGFDFTEHNNKFSGFNPNASEFVPLSLPGKIRLKGSSNCHEAIEEHFAYRQRPYRINASSLERFASFDAPAAVHEKYTRENTMGYMRAYRPA